MPGAAQQSPVVRIVIFAFVTLGIAAYILSIVLIGLSSLDHANFQTVKDEQGVAKEEPAPQPPISAVFSWIMTGIGGVLAVNFGRVIGVAVKQSSIDSRITSRSPKTLATYTLGSIGSGLRQIKPRELFVVVYAVGLIIAALFYCLDGGLKSDAGTIAADLESQSKTLVGVFIGAITSVIERE